MSTNNNSNQQEFTLIPGQCIPPHFEDRNTFHCSLCNHRTTQWAHTASCYKCGHSHSTYYLTSSSFRSYLPPPGPTPPDSPVVSRAPSPTPSDGIQIDTGHHNRDKNKDVDKYFLAQEAEDHGQGQERCPGCRYYMFTACLLCWACGSPWETSTELVYAGLDPRDAACNNCGMKVESSWLPVYRVTGGKWRWAEEMEGVTEMWGSPWPGIRAGEEGMWELSHNGRKGRWCFVDEVRVEGRVEAWWWGREERWLGRGSGRMERGRGVLHGTERS